MSPRMEALLCLVVPAVVIFSALVGIFALVGAGYDWAFIAGGTGFALVLGAMQAIALLASYRPLPRRVSR